VFHDLAAGADAIAGRNVDRVRLADGEAVVAAEPDQVLLLVPGEAVDLADLLPALADGRLRPLIHRAFPLQDALAAQDYMASNAHIGKIVLTM